MMRRLYVTFCLVVACALASSAQNSLSFYHLGNATFQNSYYNPALIPEGKVFVGLPVLSGIHMNFNNKFNYKDVIIQGEVQKEIDLNLYLKSLQKNNMVSMTTAFNLFHLGITTRGGSTLALYANERIEMDFLYPKSLMEFLIKGNAGSKGETVKIGKTRLSTTYFREFGLGYSTNVSSDLSIGVRAKYLQGFLNGSTPGGFTADLTTNKEDYSISLDMRDATFRTSGMDIFQGNTGNLGTHLISNNNRGAAIDLGFNLNMGSDYTISGSITDIGFISWKEDIKNYTLADTTMTYSGIDLKDPGDLVQTIEDSLINKFKNRNSETDDPYTTIISPKAYLSWTYHAHNGGDVIATGGARYIQGQMKFLLGAGYRHSFGKFFVGTVNVTKLPQQFFNMGAALALKGGPAQMYLAVDQVVNYDLTKFQAIDVRFGINFIIGQKEPESLIEANKPKVKRTKAGTQSFLGQKVDVKGQEGIYTIINKQERRKKRDYEFEGDPIPKEKNRFKQRSPKERY